MKLTEYEKEKTKEGNEYQDFICDLFIKKFGISISNYTSKKWQYDIGENRQGFEIKHDNILESTGNVFIEVAEKRNAENKNYVPSGIYRNDNTWLYIIGNYKEVFIFSKKTLQKIHEAKKYGPDIEIDKKTAMGFLIPKKDAKTYCVKYIKV